MHAPSAHQLPVQIFGRSAERRDAYLLRWRALEYTCELYGCRGFTQLVERDGVYDARLLSAPLRRPAPSATSSLSPPFTRRLLLRYRVRRARWDPAYQRRTASRQARSRRNTIVCVQSRLRSEADRALPDAEFAAALPCTRSSATDPPWTLASAVSQAFYGPDSSPSDPSQSPPEPAPGARIANMCKREPAHIGLIVERTSPRRGGESLAQPLSGARAGAEMDPRAKWSHRLRHRADARTRGRRAAPKSRRCLRW